MSRRRGFFQFDDPFYRPLWRRVVIVGLCIGWGLFELAAGAVGFAMLFLGVGLYAGYRLFVTYDPEDPDGTDN
ncbi:hypothetical protein OG2516_14446 [Oceanicola granulosus HTCC2516]|uniref:DUF3329 domain-containing protein n=1 Tax=Oceanicola granulosus (strain ATCC BAA-861 / DSM 15982 / KCTC 12143 / HTCC2516) TaxID=314256 RepID=Q2CEY8_OCEGH|nr:hypothetical protein [Oceanicola granulosus]EAR51222.1 hypothetical protein OG2516_14446 [Oceanicola granulosus HTCC2516]